MTTKEALERIGLMTTKRNLQDFPIGNQPKQFVKMKIKEMPEFQEVANALNELEEIKQKNKDLQNALTISYDIERQTFQDNLLMKETVEHESDILEYLKDVMDVLESLQDRLIEDYNCIEPFNQMEEDRLVIGNILDLLYDKGL